MKHSLLIAVVGLSLSLSVRADDHGQDHGKGSDENKRAKTEKHEEHEEHGDEHSDSEKHGDHHDEEGAHEEEANPSVGADKGIIEASELKGFKLSPEALKTFALETKKFSPGVAVPSESLVYSGETTSVFRVRDGFYKRVAIKKVGKPAKSAPQMIESTELRAGDEIVVKGAPFLRIAELDASGGIGEGHSH
jgi:hypothetical protein